MSFFEKLRKNIEEETEIKKSPTIKSESEDKIKSDSSQIKKKFTVSKVSKEKKENPLRQSADGGKEKEEKKSVNKKAVADTTGELSVDFYETDDYFIVRSTISGIKANDLEIFIENDLLTIKGSRQEEYEDQDKNYFHKECYWGEFSRRIILPEKVDEAKIKAKMKDGVLTLKIPKIRKKPNLKRITIREEE
jgi:HSP20 family protein